MLKQRIITAAILAALFFGILFGLSTRNFALAMLAVMMLASYEWSNLSGFGRAGAAAFCAAVLAVGLALLFRATTPGTVFFLEPMLAICGLAALFWILVAPAWLGAKWSTQKAPVMAVAGVLLITALWMGMVQLHALSPWLLLATMTIVWLADTGAYFSGKKFGRRKLASYISPNKSWEGVYGGMACVAIFAVLVVTFSSLSSMSVGARAVVVVIALALAAISVVGDLFESLMKRQAGVKDSGNTLPGHGGILDRIDAQFPVLPLAALAAAAFTAFVA